MGLTVTLALCAALAHCKPSSTAQPPVAMPETTLGRSTAQPPVAMPETTVGRSTGFRGALYRKAGRRGAGALDLDGDGTPDPWRYEYHGGSGFGGVELTVRPSAGASRFTLDTYGSFGDFLTAIEQPLELASATDLEDNVIRWVFGPGARVDLAVETIPRAPGAPTPSNAAADGSFAWLVDWRLWPDLSPAPPFVQRRVVRPRWAAGLPRPPRSQVAVLGPQLGGRLIRFIRPDHDSAARAAREPRRGAVLAYYAHNHGNLRRGPRCGTWTLYQTDHAVAVHDHATNQHAWAFVSTDVQKLRWKSLRRAACDARHSLLVVERTRNPARELWVVDPRSGDLGRLPLSSSATWRLDQVTERLIVAEPSSPPSDRVYRLGALRRTLHHHEPAVDMDGDGKPDVVTGRFSGGAHCCYRFTVHSTLAGRDFTLPLWQDGGLMATDRQARPVRSLVADFDGDKLPDLYLRINTYNGIAQPLSKALRRHGVRTHRVVVILAGGRLRIRDLR